MPTGATLILEDGFDSSGQFSSLPIHDTARPSECLRRRTIGMFLKLGLISEQFATSLLLQAAFQEARGRLTGAVHAGLPGAPGDTCGPCPHRVCSGH